MTETYTFILISALLIMLVSLVGALFTWKTLGTWLTSKLRYLIALSAGVFTVIIFNLSQEVLAHKPDLYAILAFFLSIIILETITRLLPKGSHHHDGPCTEHTHGTLDARRMLIVDAFHNVHDGLALVPAFFISPVVGFGTTAGILLHELMQEISEFFILKEAGYSTKKALIFNFLTSATILIGVALALTLVHIEHLALPLVAFAVGGFFYILVRDLAPSIIAHARMERTYVQYGTAFLIGFVLMTSIAILAPEHDHEEGDLLLPEGFGLASTPSHTG